MSSTLDLITAALNAQDAFDQAKATAQAASQALRDAQTALAAANQALHDDLAANGPAVLIDESTTPFTVTLYTAADPDSYTATVIRTAA